MSRGRHVAVSPRRKLRESKPKPWPSDGGGGGGETYKVVVGADNVVVGADQVVWRT
jgi:hypothetical protein